MSCTSCSTNKTPGGCKSNGACGTTGCGKLNVFDWLANMNQPVGTAPVLHTEVRFKNGRKEIYINDTGLELFQGDVVATEASPGHDIGVVSLTGDLVKLQMKKKSVSGTEFKKIYRKAKQNDIEKWQAARALEEETMHKARKIAIRLGLQMKISDVEYQGDKTKAIFYYTAEDRVDFRELIKLLAEEFKIRIEMRQIGARQEASRLGGIGSCGRELCCSTWLTDFRSVTTGAARYQQLSLNPLKLAGQCGKLKCCLNFELDSYLDAIKDIPDASTKLESKKGKAFHQKTDIFKRLMWFSYYETPDQFIPVPVNRVKEIVELNKLGEKPDDIALKSEAPKIKLPDFENVVGQDSLTRFDNKKKKKKKRKPLGQTATNTNQVAPQQKNKVEPKPTSQPSVRQQRTNRPPQQPRGRVPSSKPPGQTNSEGT